VDPRVAELLEGLRGEGGAVAGGAVEDDLRALVGHGCLDPRLEEAAWDVPGGGDVPLLPLVRLADVDPDGIRELLRRTRIELRDLGLRLLQQLAIGGHCVLKR